MFGKDPRQYSVMTTKFLADDDGNVRGLVTVDVEVGKDGIKVSFPLLLSRVCDILPAPHALRVVFNRLVAGDAE